MYTTSDPIHCKTYRSWFILFDKEIDLFFAWDPFRKDTSCEFPSIPLVEQEIDYIMEGEVETPDDTPALDAPWWAYR